MLINKSNYELFALDYIEGNLDTRERKAMLAFLQAHPDLETEIESNFGKKTNFPVCIQIKQTILTIWWKTIKSKSRLENKIENIYNWLLIFIGELN